MRTKWAIVTDVIVSLFCGLFALSSFFSALIYHNAGKDLVAGVDMVMALSWLAGAFKTPIEKLNNYYRTKYEKR